jgi:hypothetical protein
VKSEHIHSSSSIHASSCTQRARSRGRHVRTRYVRPKPDQGPASRIGGAAHHTCTHYSCTKGYVRAAWRRTVAALDRSERSVSRGLGLRLEIVSMQARQARRFLPIRTVHGGRPRTRAVVVHACKAPKVSWLAKILQDRKQARGDMHMS